MVEKGHGQIRNLGPLAKMETVEGGENQGSEAMDRRGSSLLVNPADRNPLWFTIQLLQGLLKLLECPLHIIVD